MKISVIIPCFNSAKTIERAISSVLESSIDVYEIIVCDDKSTDNSLKILRSLAESIEILRVVESDKNFGAGVTRRKLLEQVKGDYIAFLDSDDFWYPEKLEIQINEMVNSSAGMCIGGYDIFNKNYKKISSRVPPKLVNFSRMHFSNWIPTSMTIISSNLEGVTSMSSLRRRQDYAYWLNLFKQNKDLKCVSIRQPLGGYLRSDNSLSSSAIKNLQANYLMFRKELGYSRVLSSIIVCINSLVRILRN